MRAHVHTRTHAFPLLYVGRAEGHLRLNDAPAQRSRVRHGMQMPRCAHVKRSQGEAFTREFARVTGCPNFSPIHDDGAGNREDDIGRLDVSSP